MLPDGPAKPPQESDVQCPACGHANREGARFCGECRSPLASEAPCTACGRTNATGQRFCDGCGEPLRAATPSADRAPAPAPLPASFAGGRYEVSPKAASSSRSTRAPPSHEPRPSAVRSATRTSVGAPKGHSRTRSIRSR